MAAKPSGRMPQKQAHPNQAKMAIMFSVIVSFLRIAGYSVNTVAYSPLVFNKPLAKTIFVVF